MMVTESASILSSFEAFHSLYPDGSAHISALSKEALEALERLPIPGRKTEAWKYTPLSVITSKQWKPAVTGARADMAAMGLLDIPSYKMVLIDGHFRPELSSQDLPAGLLLMPISEGKDKEKAFFETHFGKKADHKNELFVALNTRYASNGIYLRVKKNEKLEKPVHVIHLYTQAGTAVMTRNLIIMEEGSQAHVMHSFSHSAEPIHSNVITEIDVADNAHLRLDKFQSGNAGSSHYSSEEVFQGRDAVYKENTITLSGAWTRNDPHVRLKGINSICYLNGSYFPHEKELVDNHSIIDHLVPQCESHELYKGVVYDQSKAVFNGKVFVRPDAQKTNAYQQNANIVMSDKASMNSKPELEIYADDVKCSHGSTTGQLDKDALFYLKCRGLNHDLAKQMLVHAFVGEVIDRLEIPALREYVWSQITE